jgi:hypothetical protein
MKRILLILTALSSLAALLAGCSANCIPGIYKQTNELSVSMDGITNLEIRFDARNITLLRSNDDTLEIRDYMDNNTAGDHSAVAVSGGAVTVSEADRDVLKRTGETARSKITIPETFAEALTISRRCAVVVTGTPVPPQTRWRGCRPFSGRTCG